MIFACKDFGQNTKKNKMSAIQNYQSIKIIIGITSGN